MIENKFYNLIKILKALNKESDNYFRVIKLIDDKHKNLLSKNNFIYFEFSIYLDFMFFHKKYLEKEVQFILSQMSDIVEKFHEDLKSLQLRIIKTLYYFENKQTTEIDFIKSKLSNLSVPNKIDQLEGDFFKLISFLEEYRKHLEIFMNFIFFNLNHSTLTYEMKKYTEAEYTSLNTIYLLHNKIIENIVDRSINMLQDLLNKMIYFNSCINSKKFEQYCLNKNE